MLEIIANVHRFALSSIYKPISILLLLIMSSYNACLKSSKLEILHIKARLSYIRGVQTVFILIYEKISSFPRLAIYRYLS